jgi:DNA modification methylase
LQVIRRAMELWSNPTDLVLSPFAGIGSEGYVALEMGRKFLGIELKESYFKQAVANLRAAKSHATGLFAEKTEEAKAL